MQALAKINAPFKPVSKAAVIRYLLQCGISYSDVRKLFHARQSEYESAVTRCGQPIDAEAAARGLEHYTGIPADVALETLR